jgi:hypothetical protein
MPDFANPEYRHYCRKCRTKLPRPVGNDRLAFCCRGCHRQFYRRRCVVCEHELPPPRSTSRLICKRPKCRSALRSAPSRYRWGTLPGSAQPPLKTSIKPGTKTDDFDDRPWRIVAGRMTAGQYYCATIPDGPNCLWRNGEYERLANRVRR